MLDQDNRNQFLSEIARQLGRPIRYTPEVQPTKVNELATTRLTEYSQDQLCQSFLDVAANTLLVNCVVSQPADLLANLGALCDHYGGSPIVVSGDQRLYDLGVTEWLQQHYDAVVWQPEAGELSLKAAEQAKIGVVFAEAGLTESGGVVLFSAPERGRSLSLLPESSIFILRKSAILPRVAQLAQRLRTMAQAGERMPSCINLISGPSSTADIELIKVVGVHGPIHAAYLVIDDC